MVGNKQMGGDKIIALRLSALSISKVLLSSWYCKICFAFSPSEIRPTLSRFFPHTSQLHAFPDIDSNPIIDRQDFIADIFLSTGSSIAIASTTATSVMETTSATKTTASRAESICQNGALMGELAVPGAYSSPCMLLTERVVPLPRYQTRMSKTTTKQLPSHSGTIIVQQRAGGSGNTGMTVWNSGLLLTRLLDAMTDELEQKQRLSGGDNKFWRNQDVLELGCGTGLCSIAAHRLGCNSVIATDGNSGVLQLAETNIRKNCYGDRNGDGIPVSVVPDYSLSTIRAEPLQWGLLNAMDFSESASFIIGADLTYNPGSWRALAETILTVLKIENDNMNIGTAAKPIGNRCYALYLSVGHDGFNVNSEMDGFLSVAKEVGLVNIPEGVEGINVSELLMSTLSESEKKILAQGGGFRVAVLGRKTISRL